MNILLTPNGGMPLELDDLNWIQDSYKEAFKGILHEFSRSKFGNIILSGCIVSDLGGGNYSLSEGYAMLGYEVVYVPAQNVTHVISALILDVSYDVNGSDVFFDGVTRDTYEVRRGKVYDPATTLPSLFLSISDDNRLTNIMENLIVNPNNVVQTDSTGIRHDFAAADMSSGVTINSSSPPYAIKKNGRVVLYGQIVLAPSIQGLPLTELFELPTGFRMATGQAQGEGDLYLNPMEDGIMRLGLSSTHVFLWAEIVPPSSTSGKLSLNGIVYDIEG